MASAAPAGERGVREESLTENEVRGTMASTREYVSPDGSLRFMIVSDDDGDVTLGFAGFAWHTHADILAAVTGRSEAEAVERFVQDVLGNQAVIALSRIGGEVRDVWVTERPASESRYLSEGESVELRYWDGRKWAGPESVAAAARPSER
jgi:hypothetical protein